MKKLTKLQIVDNDGKCMSDEEKRHILGGFADAEDTYISCGVSCQPGCKKYCLNGGK